MIPHTTPADWPDVRPGRFAATLRDDPAGCQVALLGLPDDTGVALNHGRVGARRGPDAVRRALAGFGSTWDAGAHRAIDAPMFDAGDIVPAQGDGEDALHATHARVRLAVGALQEAGLVTVCVGGGHDLTFPAVAAMAKHAGQPVAGVNLDAHLDVRETAGSGMPFRALVDEGWLDPRRFVQWGIGPFANSAEHVAWAREQGMSIAGVEEVLGGGFSASRALSVASGTAAFVTIDLDGIDGAQAPGVSAVNPMGLRARHAMALARLAGRRPTVRHFDLMELNPDHDLDGRTARLAAQLLLAFVSGVGERP